MFLVVLDPRISEMVNKAPGWLPLFFGISFILRPPIHHLVSAPTELLMCSDALDDPC